MLTIMRLALAVMIVGAIVCSVNFEGYFKTHPGTLFVPIPSMEE